MRTPQHAAREQQRDSMFANAGTPAPTGAVSSTVSDASLTALRHDRLAAAGGPAATQSPQLDPSLRAGLLPPGEPRAAGDAGARRQTGGATPTQRGTDRGPGGR
ncbi:hypothetical protein [Kribbella kalugense]|uniref:Uncharacterized protein n=1 Tax=Kribbella kalugense TaxID=2512221 RepID=A0A4R7ZDF3_9ACTN|nr:hypothetical protein [Kribbella kalugense]TDW15613.1 hypothetical protein EV650_7101 [Kribbella kalugense]